MTSQTNREIAEGIVAQWRSEPIHKDDFDIELLDAIQAALDEKDSKALSGRVVLPKRMPDYEFDTHELGYDAWDEGRTEGFNECLDQIKQSPPLTAENLLPSVSAFMDKGLELDQKQRAEDPMAHYVEIARLHFLWLRKHVSQKLKGVVE